MEKSTCDDENPFVLYIYYIQDRQHCYRRRHLYNNFMLETNKQQQQLPPPSYLPIEQKQRLFIDDGLAWHLFGLDNAYIINYFCRIRVNWTAKNKQIDTNTDCNYLKRFHINDLFFIVIIISSFCELINECCLIKNPEFRYGLRFMHVDAVKYFVNVNLFRRKIYLINSVMSWINQDCISFLDALEHLNTFIPKGNLIFRIPNSLLKCGSNRISEDSIENYLRSNQCVNFQVSNELQRISFIIKKSIYKRLIRI